MQLTQKQESLISRHLRDLANQLDDALPEKNRERSLRQVQLRIYRELEALQKAAISDEDVVAALRRATTLGASEPGTAAPAKPSPANLRGATTPSAAPRQAPPRQSKAPATDAPAPIWLGVCVFNADRFGVSHWIVRLFAVLLGLVTGPVAIFCYLAAYAEYYLAIDAKDRPQVAYGQLALRVVAPLAVAIGLRWGTYKLLDLIAYGHERLFRESLPPLGKWNWIDQYEGTAFFLLCASVIPVSILSGLPLANAWGHSMKRLAQALVALYFMALCFGIASVLVGVILDRVQPYLQ